MIFPMFSCCCPSTTRASRAEVEENYRAARVESRNFKITAMVLGLLALMLTAGSFVLYGIGTMPPTWMAGLGFFPYLAGGVVGFSAVGILFGAFICFIIYSVRTCQKDHWHEAILRKI